MQLFFRFSIFFYFIFIAVVSLKAQEQLAHKGKILSPEECIEISAQKETAGDKKEASRFLNQAATIHWERKEYNKAVELFERSLKLNESIANLQGMIGIYSNLGMIYADQSEYSKSLLYFDKAVAGRRQGKDKVALASNLINTAVVLNNLKQHDKAAVYLEEALAIAREKNDMNQMKSCYGMLAETYEKAKNNEKMMMYFDLYKTFHEQIQKDVNAKHEASAMESRLRAELLELENRNKQLALAATSQELQEKEEELTNVDAKNRKLLNNLSRSQLAMKVIQNEAELNQAKLALTEEKLNSETQLRNLALFVIFMVVGLLVFLYKNYREKKKTNQQLSEQNIAILEQKEEIEQQKDQLHGAYTEIKKKNDNITQSINYAQRIQKAILPKISSLQSAFPMSFILYKPKDIVSGDFYWFAQKDNKFIVAAADCTGHGVPGAFMSMIGNDLLHKIVSVLGITSPEQILATLRHEIYYTLNQEHSETKDGMDISIAAIDAQKTTLELAAAMNPMYYIQDNELHEIKGDKCSIGGDISREFTYNKHTIALDKPTTLYLFSDGYADQIGGEHNKKFMSKNFRQFLLNIHQQPMETQKTLLDENITNWVKKTYQIDDILVIGLQIN